MSTLNRPDQPNHRSASRHAVALGAAFVLSVASALPVALGQGQGQNQTQPQSQNPNATPAKAGAPAGTPSGAPIGASTGAPTAAPGGDAAKTDPNKVVLTVGNEKLTAGQIDALVNDLPPQQQQMLARAGKHALADTLVRIKLFSQEAQKRELDKEPKVHRQLELTHDQIMANALADDVLRKNYEANKEKYEKVRARHILIRTPGSRAPVRPGQKELTDAQAKAKAEDIRKQLLAGADFAELARKESDDVSSGAQGGSMDPFGHGAMVPEFDKAAFAMKEGEISQPVKTQFGYHIIQLQNHLGFEEVQQDVAAQSNAQVQKLIEDLKKNTPVQVDETYFGPAPTAAGPAGAGLGQGAAPGAPGTPGAAPAGATGSAQPPQPGQPGQR